MSEYLYVEKPFLDHLRTLDKKLREHGLLQAIARVNRVELDKALPDYPERQRWLREHGAGMGL